MDETTATILLGCHLAKDLEANLFNMANQPELLTRSCDEIISVFTNVKERISMSYPQMVLGHEPHESQHLEIPSGVPEWLKNSHTQATDLLHAQISNARSAFTVHWVPDTKMEETEHEHTELGEMVRRIGGKRAEGSNRLRDDRGPEASNSARAVSTQRQGRRRHDGEKRTMTVPAPRMGNTEIPPEDGYTWRKYGQKDILNSKFPRSYFRCTHQKLYHCPAKKRVQRLDDDPNMFEVIYIGRHTCHLSATAPSVPPPSEIRIQQPTALHHPHPPPSTSAPLPHWLSMDIRTFRQSTSASSVVGMQMNRDFGLAAAGAGTSNSNMAVTSNEAGAGPSSSARYGSNFEYQPVVDMADAMFNSGSSSNTSMELIFCSMDDKWDSGEKKI